MAQKIGGKNTPVPAQEVWDFDVNGGLVKKLIYKGYSQPQMVAMQQDYIASGIACRLSFFEGNSTFEVQDSASQQFTIDTWQIVGNDISVDIFSNPKINGQVTDAQMALIRQFLADDSKPADAFADPGLTSLSAIVKRYYSLYQRGSTDYRRGQYVLRHTTNAPSRWGVNVSDIGVDKIYDTGELLSEVQNSGSWFYPLPGRLGFKIANIPSPIARADHQWGWLKGASTETTAANNRIDIQTEYTLEQWSTDLYDQY